MAIIKCPECGNPVSNRARTCPHCGVDIAGQITTCPDCGEAVFKDAAQCSNCHCTINAASVVGEQPAAPPRPVRSAEDTSGPAKQKDTKPNAAPRTKVKRSYSAIVVSLVLALIIVLLGLYFYQTTQQQNELRAYRNAMMSGEPAVLQEFLHVYADAPVAHADSVRNRLQELQKTDKEWNHAQASKSKAELQRYITRHPGNIHVAEAHVLIDSLDWLTARKDSSAESFQLYIDEHPEGLYINEARDLFARLDAQRLKPEDRDMLRQLFLQFFNALSQRSELALQAALAPNMAVFMGKSDAVAADATAFMNGLYAQGDIVSISYTLKDDWTIEKKPTELDGQFVFHVKFVADKRIERSNHEKELYSNYQVTAVVNPECRIVAFNMVRPKPAETTSNNKVQAVTPKSQADTPKSQASTPKSQTNNTQKSATNSKKK